MRGSSFFCTVWGKHEFADHGHICKFISDELTILVPKAESAEKALKSMFQNSDTTFPIVIDALIEFGVLDVITKKCLIKGKPRKGNLLFKIIAAIEVLHNQILIKKYTDKELLNAFNSFLQTNWPEVGRRANNFYKDSLGVQTFLKSKLHI